MSLFIADHTQQAPTRIDQHTPVFYPRVKSRIEATNVTGVHNSHPIDGDSFKALPLSISHCIQIRQGVVNDVSAGA
ncbi:hypothetical protein [Spirosoma aerophilum]